MKRLLPGRRTRSARQRSFAFLDRSRRRQRWFKMAILVMTCLAIAALFGALPRGRYALASVPSLARQTIRGALGIQGPQERDRRTLAPVPPSGDRRLGEGVARGLRPVPVPTFRG